VSTNDLKQLASIAEAIRTACVSAAIQAYEDAGIRGLCDDGRWEYAIAAMRRLDLQSLNGLTEDPPRRVPDAGEELRMARCSRD
jgi:hypothetical protein